MECSIRVFDGGHHHIGHSYTGHDYIGHDHVGHDYIGHNVIGHNYIRHNCIDHNRRKYFASLHLMLATVLVNGCSTQSLGDRTGCPGGLTVPTTVHVIYPVLGSRTCCPGRDVWYVDHDYIKTCPRMPLGPLYIYICIYKTRLYIDPSEDAVGSAPVSSVFTVSKLRKKRNGPLGWPGGPKSFNREHWQRTSEIQLRFAPRCPPAPRM